ncbi:MAG: Spx/MgsR family RNA polymerase-binding regulatory protein [Pseudomonadota bacterium]
MITIYTLKTCDTCKKALKWLDAQGIAYNNIDVRADGMSQETIKNIVTELGWEKSLNRRSTTWRGLSDAEKAGLDNARAIALIEAHPTLMKRPVVAIGNQFFAGFDEATKLALRA